MRDFLQALLSINVHQSQHYKLKGPILRKIEHDLSIVGFVHRSFLKQHSPKGSLAVNAWTAFRINHKTELTNRTEVIFIYQPKKHTNSLLNSKRGFIRCSRIQGNADVRTEARSLFTFNGNMCQWNQTVTLLILFYCITSSPTRFKGWCTYLWI